MQQQVELDAPFRVTVDGRIAFTTDPSRALHNHVITIIGTQTGERVVRPTYGTDVQGSLFEGDDDNNSALLQSDIERALVQYEPGILVRDVFTSTGNQLDGTIDLNVTYSAANSPLATASVPVNTAVLYQGGAVEEERSG